MFIIHKNDSNLKRQALSCVDRRNLHHKASRQIRKVSRSEQRVKAILVSCEVLSWCNKKMTLSHQNWHLYCFALESLFLRNMWSCFSIFAFTPSTNSFLLASMATLNVFFLSFFHLDGYILVHLPRYAYLDADKPPSGP